MLLVCIGQIEASTSPLGIPRAFDTFAFPGRRELQQQQHQHQKLYLHDHKGITVLQKLLI